MNFNFNNLELGYFCLVLHAHLPFVHHPEHEYFLEEDWLFEAITETYIPLINIFENFEKTDIDFKITMSLTPTLLAMLSNKLLQEKYIRHINGLISLSEKEIKRTIKDKNFNEVAKLYNERYHICKTTFVEKYNCNLVEAFKYFQDKGNIEIITSAATHGYLPLLNISPQSIKAQIKVAVDDYKRYFDINPAGIWLPECGFYHGLDSILNEFGLKYFFLDAHGIIYGNPRPTFGNYAPVKCQSGIHAFARDLETSKMVWSKEHGYPGDVYYREFYRDIGWELDWDYLEPYLGPYGLRKNLGIKYFRITDRNSHNKEVYEPFIAGQKVEAHAQHFLSCRMSQVRGLNKEMHKNPIIVSTYDAELFGHWWFEGPQWIEMLYKKIINDQKTVKLITPSEYLKIYPVNQSITPSQSSWGDRGYHEFWLNSSNDWIYKHIHEAAFRMSEMAREHPSAEGILERALNQAARELLLAQSSDWPFIMRTGTTVDYAKKRFKDHIARFTNLYFDVKNNTIEEVWLSEIELIDNIFPEIDYKMYL